jgi:SAM-dependent methyltransferase
MPHNGRVQGYGEDLAYIQDAGHSDYALDAAPGLLRILKQRGAASGLVVDLGCGSGRWARELNRAGYQVFGVDQSKALIRIARRVAPESEFAVASLWDAELPRCNGITSLGECLNYCFDPTGGRMLHLFRRAWRALRSGGLLVFDFATPARLRARTPVRNWREGSDWAVLVNVAGDREQNILRREIVSFRKIGQLYRRSEETHLLRLYRPADVVQDLARCGFRTRILRGYGRFRFPRGISGVLAVKP